MNYLDKDGLIRLKQKITNMIAERVITWNEITGKPTSFNPSSHSHTKNQISDFPTSLKNPNALTIKLNGSNQGGYDGSSSKEVNITPVSIGAAPSSHSHSYAGSSSVGGSANSAVKLDASAGTSTQPVYFSGGKPVAISYTIGASVPAGAKFTDTTYNLATQSANGLQSAADKKKLDGIATGANAYSHPSTHPSSMIDVTIGTNTVKLSDIISCAVFPIAQDDDSVTFGNIEEWLAAGKPKL